MSHKKNQEEARRWYVTGKDDLDTAIIYLLNFEEGSRYPFYCSG